MNTINTVNTVNTVNTANTAKAAEYRIIQQLLSRPDEEQAPAAQLRWADRLILVIAATAALVVAGAVLQELLWVLLAAGAAHALGST